MNPLVIPSVELLNLLSNGLVKSVLDKNSKPANTEAGSLASLRTFVIACVSRVLQSFV
jgi:hypothetical protein